MPRIFAGTDVLGFEQIEYELTPDAVDLGLEQDASRRARALGPDRWVGRGERHSPATSDLPITMRLAEPPEPFDWLRSA